MPRRSPQPFRPPSAEQVAAYLARHFVTGPSKWVTWLPAMLLAAAVLLALAWTNAALTMLVWIMLLGMFVSTMVRARGVREANRILNSVQEFTLRREHDQALRAVWGLIPQLRAQPQMHAKAVALLAHNLQYVHAFDASAVAFDEVIQKLPEEHPAACQLRVEQVMALLACDQLTDADNSLRRLRYVLDKFPGTTIAAGYHLAEIYQQVRTNHFQDVLDRRDDVMNRLRPLGIDAAYGYAMVALSCFHMRHTNPALLSQATLWWDRACLLNSPTTLVSRFEELKAIAQSPAVAAKAADDASGVTSDSSADFPTGGDA